MTIKSLIVSLLLTLALAACGKKSETPVAPTPTPAPVTTPIAAPDLSPPPAELAAGSIDEPMPPVDESATPPQVIARCQLQQLNSELKVSGEVTVYQADDGSRLLRIENLLTPAEMPIELAFVRSSEPKAPADLEGRIKLGPLKGGSGNMNYLLDRALNLEEQRSLVLIIAGENNALAWCPLTPPAP